MNKQNDTVWYSSGILLIIAEVVCSWLMKVNVRYRFDSPTLIGIES